MAQVEVVYVSLNKQLFHTYHDFQSGMTVQDVLQQSGIFSAYPEAADFSVGIFSVPVDKTKVLQPGDRVEVYRPLLGDPKEKRRKRAQKR